MSIGAEIQMGKRIFLYHANGFALGGRITQPLEQEINSHAATALSIVGGLASAKADSYRLKDLISYRSAHTYISGIQNNDTRHSTVVNTVVEDLNILDVITADSVIGRLSSTHEDGQPAKIIPLGSTFQNLKIAGKPVEVDLFDNLFAHHSTHSSLVDHFLGKCNSSDPCAGFTPPTQLRYEWGHPVANMPATLQERLLAPPIPGWQQSGSHLYCSLVRSVREASPSGAVNAPPVPYAHAIKIPDVGRLYLGELTSSEDTKRLTMMRLELGSPVVGSLAVAGLETNGKWYP
jgi:hypothetical protein